jgi:hypothetical protein
MLPIGVSLGDKPYHAHFLKCPSCSTYYSYENWQQGIGNIGEFDQIDRFTEAENKFIKPIFEAKSTAKLKKSVIAALNMKMVYWLKKPRLHLNVLLKHFHFPLAFLLLNSS